MKTKQDLAALQEQWNTTAPASGGAAPSDLPDGTYEFAITNVKANLNKYGLRITYQVVGGNESFIGEEITVQDNLDTAQNMGWFKDRMRRLGIEKGEMEEGGTFSEITTILADSDSEGSIGAAIVGKKFEGLKQHKKGYDNVYVNRLLGEVDADELPAKSEEEPAAEESEQTEESVEEDKQEGGIVAGARVSFTSKKDGEQVGVVAEVFTDENTEEVRARVDSDNGKRYNLLVEALTLASEAQDETEEEVEEKPAKAVAKPSSNGHGGKKMAIPKYPSVKGLRMPEIKAILAGYNFKAESIPKPREFLAGIAGIVHNAKYTPDLTELTALCGALGVKKGAKPADTIKSVRQVVAKKFA